MKVLMISHNSFSTYQNMGKTFLSLFSGFEPGELCQLYIYPNIPNVAACGSCYRVTDKEILTRLNPGGEVDNALISAGNELFERESDRALYRNPANGSPMRRLLRDAAWKLGRWNNKNLNRWLDREKPDCIFLAPGYAKFIYDIALNIAKKRSLPIVTYICDDYYFSVPPSGAAGRLYRRLLRRKIEELMAKTSHLVTISPEMGARYSAFGVPTTTIMTGAGTAAADKPRMIKQPDNLCYFGNLSCGRHRALAQVGRELDSINAELGTDFALNVYTAEQNEGILSAFDGIKALRLRGFVTGAEFHEAMEQAHLLLHVEGLDGESTDRVKYSVSTKIADSLAVGIPLVAYGPKGVSSMEHLLRNRCALTATSEGELRQTLRTAFFNEKERERVASCGLQTARELHDSGVNSARLREVLSGTIERKRDG